MHIQSNQAVGTCLDRSNRETQTAHTGTRTRFEISSGRLCDDAHDIATGSAGQNRSLFALLTSGRRSVELLKDLLLFLRFWLENR